MRSNYSQVQLSWLKTWYRHWSVPYLTIRFNKKFKCRKTPQQIKSTITNHKLHSGRTGYFAKGHIPWCAGTKGLMKPNSGSFKKGNIPANRRKIGSKRIDSKDGYVLIKIRERNPYTGEPTRFKLKHVVLWERKNGPIPKGRIIIFKDGNKYNFRPENLICVSKAEHVRLNQMHYKNQPKELKSSVFALAKLKTKMGERMRGK